MSEVSPLDWMDEPKEAPAAAGDAPAAKEPNGDAQEAPANGQPQPEVPAAQSTGGEPEVSADAKSGFVPLSALLDTRDRAQKAEQELAALKAAAANAAPAEEFEIPDPATDPVAYAQYVDQTTQQSIMNERLNVSQRFAMKEHGKEVVDTVQAWAIPRFSTDAAFRDRVFGSPDPYGEAIAIYQEEQRLAALKDVPMTELEEFRAWKASQQGGQPAASGQNPAQPQPAAPASAAAVPPSAPAAKKPVPPASINDATNAGGGVSEVATGPGQSFDSVFAN